MPLRPNAAGITKVLQMPVDIAFEHRAVIGELAQSQAFIFRKSMTMRMQLYVEALLRDRSQLYRRDQAHDARAGKFIIVYRQAPCQFPRNGTTRVLVAFRLAIIDNLLDDLRVAR